tara:strand:- start:290 stop:868 length:579 start_codon:yes stop_codon:yes gene_type:complete
MTEILIFYLKLGFSHVIDRDGLDHLYFIVTLAMPFTFKDSKKLLLWVTLFTFGHTLSLLGNFYSEIVFSSYWVELLIPITIAINAIMIFPSKQNLVFFNKTYFFSIITLIFGLIHGLGFARYFKIIIPEDDVEYSLFSFALGVELAQIAIVTGTLILSFFIVQILKQSKNNLKFLVGAMILSQALEMILERI